MTGAVSRRRGLRLAAVAAVALVVQLLPGYGMSARGQEARKTSAYDCVLPSGTWRVEVSVAATFPARAMAALPIRPTSVGVTVRLPAGVVGELPPEAAALSGTATLVTAVTQGRQRAQAQWAGLTAAETPRPRDADVELRFTGDVPQVTVDTAGDVTFAAQELELALATEQGAEPARLSCAPAQGADTLLATVPVAAPASAAPDATAEPDGTDRPPKGIEAGPAPRATTGECPAEPPRGSLDPERLPEVPAGAEVTENEPTSLCAVPVGFATIRKLKGSTIVNDPRGPRVGLMHLAFNTREVAAPGYHEYDHLGRIDLPDAESTFLTFGFQPTTAKVRFEAGPATVVNVVREGRPTTTSVGYHQHLRLYDVRVGGVPLPVGPRCRTARPIDTRLTGTYPVSSGGLLQGELEIPPFTGCGTAGEDLDALFTAAISGPGNALRIQQGRVCTGSSCRNAIPKPPDL